MMHSKINLSLMFQGINMASDRGIYGKTVYVSILVVVVVCLV
jgi:hypothetical protein